MCKEYKKFVEIQELKKEKLQLQRDIKKLLNEKRKLNLEIIDRRKKLNIGHNLIEQFVKD